MSTVILAEVGLRPQSLGLVGLDASLKPTLLDLPSEGIAHTCTALTSAVLGKSCPGAELHRGVVCSLGFFILGGEKKKKQNQKNFIEYAINLESVL